MSFFGLNFGGNAEIDIVLDNQDERKMADIRDENGRKERLYLFLDGESVTGKVNITLHRKTNRLEHHGLKIEFIGQIELYYDRGNHHEFLSLVKQLAGPGELTQNTSFDFEFNQVEKPFECYTGANVRLRYFLRVTLLRRLTDMVKEMDVLVHTLATYAEMNNPIKMEVGIEECLHIEFEYNKSKYHLKDVIVGKIYFLLVRIKIKHMEVAIIKREITGSGPNTFHDNETIAKYEIMDGAPVRGESIPIRVFLAGYDLTPTMRDINKRFSVKYYLNLVLVDEEDRRYFKQQEITLWRKGEWQARKGQLPLPQQHVPLPHAMARHVGGEYPSQNIRTAPTPSEPNTPDPVGYQPGLGAPLPGPRGPVLENNIPEEEPSQIQFSQPEQQVVAQPAIPQQQIQQEQPIQPEAEPEEKKVSSPQEPPLAKESPPIPSASEEKPAAKSPETPKRAVDPSNIPEQSSNEPVSSSEEKNASAAPASNSTPEHLPPESPPPLDDDSLQEAEDEEESAEAVPDLDTPTKAEPKKRLGEEVEKQERSSAEAEEEHLPPESPPPMDDNNFLDAEDDDEPAPDMPDLDDLEDPAEAESTKASKQKREAEEPVPS